MALKKELHHTGTTESVESIKSAEEKKLKFKKEYLKK